MVRSGYFKIDQRNKDNFLITIETFKEKEKLLRGHVEFIKAALKNMEEFGVHKDLEVTIYLSIDFNACIESS